jgi:DNA-binding SARP family transcriptional activator
VQFRVLGLVRAWRGDAELDLGPPKQRALLALLLVGAGHPVSLPEILHVLWGEDPPDTAVNVVHRHIGGLRRMLEPELPPRGTSRWLVRSSGGYRLDVDPAAIDLFRFRGLHCEAAQLAEKGRPGEASEVLLEALSLWRGRTAAGIPPEIRSHRVFAAVDSEELAAIKLAASCALAAEPGFAERVLSVLRQIAGQYPLDEVMQAQLMVVLAATGRQAEALEVYQSVRDTLVGDLGLDPGPELRAAQRQVLRQLTPTGAVGDHSEQGGGEAAQAPLSPAPRPAQLPADLAVFVGRCEEDDQFRALLSEAADGPSASMIITIVGLAGVGKTVLAVRWAHRVADRFPDGQLYVNLRGFEAEGAAVDPAEVMGWFLQALGVSASAVPSGPDARAALYRSVLAGRRCLIVLDNASGAGQVLPLLPGGPGCLVLVTSRGQLPALVAATGARTVPLDVLTVVEAEEFLTRRLGERWVAAEPVAAGELIELCGRLPLALAVICARVGSHPAMALSAVVAELRQADGTLDGFAGIDSAAGVRAVLRQIRRRLVDELRVQPGVVVPDGQRTILGDADPSGRGPKPDHAPSILPTAVARVLRDGLAERPCFGREENVAHLRGLVRAAARGIGGVVWVDGEPGIGKTELLTLTFADAADFGCQLAWGTADELGQRVPLLVLSRALGLEMSSPLRGPAAGLSGGREDPRDDMAVAMDRILGYVRSVCAVAPLVLVVDDMHWADATTVLVWHRLVALTAHAPLLLVAAARPDPHTRELALLRRSAKAVQQQPMDLQPLAVSDLERLIVRLVGRPIGENLRAVAGRAAGNPLFTREMVAALARSGAVHIADGRADIDAAQAVEPPESLLAAIRATVDFLSPDTQEILQLAALLGTEFAAIDLAAVSGRTPFELTKSLGEAIAANVVVDAGGGELAFRHPFLRQALAESVSGPMRAVLHRHAAEVLAREGRPLLRIAEQLGAGLPVIDRWVVQWLTGEHRELVRRAPQIAGDLLRRALDTDLPSQLEREVLLIALVRVAFRSGQHPVAEAAQAMYLATDVRDRADMRQLLATMRFREGDAEGAARLLEAAAGEPDLPQIWRTRHTVLLAQVRHRNLNELDGSERVARRIIADAGDCADSQPFEVAFAHQSIWLTSTIGRHHEQALRHVDCALDLIRHRPDMVAMYFDLLDNKIFSLQNLDRLDEANQALREASTVGTRHGVSSALPVATSVQHYWQGRWDEAVAEIGGVTDDAPGITFRGNREPAAIAMLIHGVAALIAARRDSPHLAAAHLDAADATPATDAERESCDFLLVAKSLLLEQQGRPEDALELLTPQLAPDYAPMMLRHQWLPDLVRLALSTGRSSTAVRAADICAAEASKEVVPARAHTASARCQALLTTDPAPAIQAAAHYRSVGRLPELAATLEDIAVLQAAAGRRTEAAATADEAIAIFTGLGAAWDRTRASRRFSQAGVSGV